MLNAKQSLTDIEVNIAFMRSQIAETKTQERALYIPLFGFWNRNQQEQPFDLDQAVKRFLQSDQEILLLLGDTGAGKSLYCHDLATQLWAQYDKDAPIPLLISLPVLTDPIHNAIEETLSLYGFNKQQINKLKETRQFIFILDSYDEIYQFKNLYVTNRLVEWQAKIVITCRFHYLLSIRNYKFYFAPVREEKVLFGKLKEITISPFSSNQVDLYLQRYVEVEQNLAEKDWRVYRTHINGIPGLKQLIKTPFLLRVAVEVMPDIIQRYAQKQISEKLQLSQVALYDAFIENWFQRQELKLINSGKINEKDVDIQRTFWAYSKALAKKFHEQGITHVTYRPKSGLFTKEEKDEWDRFFASDPKIALIRSACPLKQAGENQYTFLHASLIDYFVTKQVYDELFQRPILAPESTEGRISSVLTETEKPASKGLLDSQLNQNSIVHEIKMLQFLADRVIQDEMFKQKLFELIFSSRKDARFAIGAANAISILNAAKISFAGLDLNNIIIPNAYLEGAIFHETDLQGANLTGANLCGAFLVNTNLQEAQLTDIYFGENFELQHEERIDCFTYSPNGKHLVVGSENKLYIWDAQEGQLLQTFFAHEKAITTITYHPRYETFASGGKDRTIHIWNANTGELLKTLKGHADAISCLLYHPQVELIVSSSLDRTLRIWDSNNGLWLRTLTGHKEKINSIACHHIAPLMVSASDDQSLRVWNMETGDCLQIVTGHTAAVTDVVYHPSGDLIISGSMDGTIRIWRTIDNHCVQILGQQLGAIISLKLHPNEERIAAKNFDGVIYEWDLKTGEQLYTFCTNIRGNLTNIAYHPSGEQIISTALNNVIRGWDVKTKTGVSQQELKAHTGNITCVKFHPTKEQIASASFDGTIRIWDDKTGKNLRTFRGHGVLHSLNAIGNFVKSSPDFLIVNGIDYHPDEEKLVSAGMDCTVRIWDNQTGACLKILAEHKVPITSIVYHPSGKQIILGGMDSTIRILDANTGNCFRVIEQNADIIFSLACHPNYEWVAAGNEDNSICVWDIETGALLQSLKKHEGSVYSVVYHPYENWLVSGSADHTIYLWNIDSGKPQQVLTGHTKEVYTVACHPYNEWIISGSADKTLRIWDANNGSCLQVLEAFAAGVRSLSINQSGNLVTGGDDYTVSYWSPSTCNSEHIQYHLQLRTNSTLLAKGTQLQNSTGLSFLNEFLLKRRGAIGDSIARLLFSAIQEKNTQRIISLQQQLVDPNADLSSRDKDGNTVLHIAIKEELPDLIGLLINHPNVSVNAKNNMGDTPLSIAIKMNNIVLAEKLLGNQQIDTKVKDVHGNTLLNLATLANNLYMVNLFLLNPQIDITAKNNEGKTALSIAIEEDYGDIAQRLLVDQQIKVDIRDNQENTLLHLAAKKNCVQTMRLLVDNQMIDIDAMNNEGKTALEIAFNNLCAPIIRLLICHPYMKITEKNEAQMQVLLWFAVDTGNTALFQALLAYPPLDINQENDQGKTLLQYAIDRARVKIIQLLLMDPRLIIDFSKRKALIQQWTVKPQNVFLHIHQYLHKKKSERLKQTKGLTSYYQRLEDFKQLMLFLKEVPSQEKISQYLSESAAPFRHKKFFKRDRYRRVRSAITKLNPNEMRLDFNGYQVFLLCLIKSVLINTLVDDSVQTDNEIGRTILPMFPELLQGVTAELAVHAVDATLSFFKRSVSAITRTFSEEFESDKVSAVFSAEIITEK